jgi:hypothetical protein
MQSKSRAIRRGHAVLALDSVTKRTEFYTEKGTGQSAWDWAKKKRSPEAESRYCEQITKPITSE